MGYQPVIPRRNAVAEARAEDERAAVCWQIMYDLRDREDEDAESLRRLTGHRLRDLEVGTDMSKAAIQVIETVWR